MKRFVFLILLSVQSATFASSCRELFVHLFVHSSPVKDQCGTGSCWAHPITAMLEQRVRTNRKKEVSLSEEFLFLSSLTRQMKSNLENVWSLSDEELRRVKLLPLSEGSDPGVVKLIGVVPDEVYSSELIRSSRNIFSNPKRMLHREYPALFNYLKEAVYGTNEKEARENKWKDALSKGLVRIQKKYGVMKGSWKVEPNGVEKFLFDGEWYNPREFLYQYVLRGDKDPIYSYTQKANFAQVIEKALKQDITLTARLYMSERDKLPEMERGFERKTMSHSVEVVGIKYQADLQHVKAVTIKNSWGGYWQNGGYIDIPYEEFLTTCHELLVVAPNGQL